MRRLPVPQPGSKLAHGAMLGLASGLARAGVRLVFQSFSTLDGSRVLEVNLGGSARSAVNGSERLRGSQSLREAGETVVGQRLEWRGVRDELVGLRPDAGVLVQ